MEIEEGEWRAVWRAACLRRAMGCQGASWVVDIVCGEESGVLVECVG